MNHRYSRRDSRAPTSMSDVAQFEVAEQDSVTSLSSTNARKTLLGGTGLLFGLALAKLILQFAGINHYGFFRDELYYMACGEHLAWGYVDQPPLIAFVAWFARHIFGPSLAPSLVSVRLFPILAGAAVVFITGLLAR